MSRHVNVAAWLPEMASLQPEALAVAVARGGGRYDRLSSLELDSISDRAAHALLAAGIGKGTRTVLMVKPSVEFFALTFALFKLAAVPVMVDPGMGLGNLGQCLAEAEPQAFLGIPKAQLARLCLGWARSSLEIRICVGPRLFLGMQSLARLMAKAPAGPYPMAETKAEEMAAILFTSGSTGLPKGVVYSHGIFSAQVELLRQVYGIEPGEVDLSTFPLFALFGPALGMASVVPEMDASRPGRADPRKLVRALKDFSCTNMFASPALIDKLGRHCEKQGVILKSLRRAISAGAPASPDALARFAGCLREGVEVLTPYGATEALPVTSIGSNTILLDTRKRTEAGGGVCVGRPVPGMQVAVIGISDEPIELWSEELRLPPGEIGEIVVRGPVVTASYYNRAESTKLAKIRDPDSKAILHRMGDLGYLDQEGRLWMCGRKSHRVEARAGTMYTLPCEAVFNTHPRVRRSALVGVGRAGAQRPVLCVELKAGARPGPETTREILALGKTREHTKAIDTLLYHPSFPVDVRHNAKIFREQLATWARKRLA